jgi:transcriptional regulator
MHLPAHFEVTDTALLFQVVRRHPLATWATVAGGLPVVNHVPFWLDTSRGEQGTLVAHVSRANPIWRTPAPSVLAFHAGDAFVSPSWYPGKRQHGKVVPTWNYAVVHAHGCPRPIEDRGELMAIVTRLTDSHEAAQTLPWRVDDAPPDYIERMLGAIVGIEITVQRWVGKFKLSQNRDAADHGGVVAALGAHPIAGLMTANALR